MKKLQVKREDEISFEDLFLHIDNGQNFHNNPLLLEIQNTFYILKRDSYGGKFIFVDIISISNDIYLKNSSLIRLLEAAKMKVEYYPGSNLLLFDNYVEMYKYLADNLKEK